MNKQELASKIWESANEMRSKIEANEYKDYILGFMFYKYLSDREVRYLYDNDWTEETLSMVNESMDPEVINSYRTNLGYFISYENLFSTWLEMESDFDISNVRDALSAFSRLIDENHKNVFSGIFDTLETGLSKLGDSSSAQTKAVSGLIHLIKDIPMDGKQDYDVLGFVYEYLIGMFAANAGKKAGEFYTPHEVSVLMSEIIAEHLKDRNEIQIYDPTSGSGSLLINIGSSVSKYMNDNNKIKYYAQELKQNTYNLTRMNLVMRGILPDNIIVRNGDTLEDDWPYFEEGRKEETYNALYVDAVVSNPPYSQKWNPSGRETDPRYSRFGLAPKSKADYAFLLHDLYHLKPEGIMTIVLPHGVLFRGGEEGEIRKNLIENNHIDAIIGLPANIFFGTGIPTIIMVLKQKRENTDIFIVDASKGFIKEGKNNKLRASDIKRISDAVKLRKNIDKFSRSVSRKEIRENDYNLNIPRYVDSSEEAESWDIYATMFGGIPKVEVDALCKYWDAFVGLKEDLFESNDSEYVSLKSIDVKHTIYENTAIQDFISDFLVRFSSFKDYLKTELISELLNVNIAKEEVVISADIFNRMESIPLLDKYVAYQILDDIWGQIAIDLEIIQTEGMAAIRQVNPNMVTKKKNGKEVTVQEGWLGHVLPFELVQQTMLADDANAINIKDNRLAEIYAEIDEILDSLSEEEKDSDITNEASDAFNMKGVKAYLKANKANLEIYEGSFDSKMQQIVELDKTASALKKELKIDRENLHEKTKITIETLTDDSISNLLCEKWIVPLVIDIEKMPNIVIENLVKAVNYLADKYKVTFSDIEDDIATTSAKLSHIISDLTANEFEMQGLKELKKILEGNV